MGYIRRFFRELSSCWRTYLLVLFLQLLMVALSMGYVWLSKRLVDVAVLLFSGSQSGAVQSAVQSGAVQSAIQSGVHSDAAAAAADCDFFGGGMTALVAYAAIFAGLAILRPVVTSAMAYLRTKMTVNMANGMRLRLFDTLLHLKGGQTAKYHSGDMLNRIQGDVASVASTFCGSVPDLFWAAVQFSAAFAYLLILDARLAWILVAVIPLALFGGRYVMFRVRALTRDIRDSDSAVQSHIQESVQHVTLLQTLEHTDVSSGVLEDLQTDNYAKNMRRARFSVVARTLVAFSFTAGFAVAFLWSVFGIAHGVVSYGLMTAILQLVGQVQRPLVQASDRLPSLMHCTASIDRIEEIENLPRESVSERRFIDGATGVRLEHLSFRYPDGASAVFTDLSYDFAPGSKTAIVGPTGIGKSTLIRLMLSLLTPTSGSVSLYSLSGTVSPDAFDSHSGTASVATSKSLSGAASGKTSSAETDGSGPVLIPVSEATRCNLVYVPQGNTLFSGTIRENLQMGDPNASEQRMEEALRIAAADFVLDLPDGLDTACFEQGGGLSEGQAQRIAIARALLRPGGILLLDEFSSALDNATEDLLLSRLTSSLPGRTMIFITHRDRVIDYCDSVLRL